MRLIDADRMKTTHEIQMGDYNSMESIREWIDRQPTAYDVEAVVRKLEQCKYLEGPYMCEWDEAYNTCIEDAIDIVRRGVRNDD